MRESSVFCLGLTPALQRTVVLDGWVPDGVNRAKEVRESAAGKAVNVAHALANLGIRAVAAGFNGGDTGRKVARMAEAAGVMCAFTAMPAPTRICTTLIDRQARTVTEVVEEAPPVGEALLERFTRQCVSRIRRSVALAISGTLPPGLPEDFYVPFVRAANAAGIPTLIDSHRAPLLKTLPENPYLAKLNVHELEVTLGKRMKNETAIRRGLKALREMGAENVFLTCGGDPAYLLTADGTFTRIEPPRLKRVLNPIGSGDCTLGGLIAALLNGRSLADAVRYGLACGTANVETMLPAEFTPPALTEGEE